MSKKIFTKKNCIWAAAILLVIVAIIIAVNKHNAYKKELNNYNYAVSCVMNKDYDTALENFYKCSYSFNDTFEWEQLIKGHECLVEGEYADAYDYVEYINFQSLTPEQRSFVDKRIGEIEKAYEKYEKTQETTTRSIVTTTRSAERYYYTTKKHKTTDSDPYDAKSYRNEEDFYYDHYDDFYDYYDAENYYDEHQD